MPAGLGAGRPIAAAALQLLPAHLLFKDSCVEQARLPFTVKPVSCPVPFTIERAAKQADYLVERPRISFCMSAMPCLAVVTHGECAADRSDLPCVWQAVCRFWQRTRQVVSDQPCQALCPSCRRLRRGRR